MALCMNCIYWILVEGQLLSSNMDGVCHRGLPQLYCMGDRGSPEWVCPIVAQWDWCTAFADQKGE